MIDAGRELVCSTQEILVMADVSRQLHEFACDEAERALRASGVGDERCWRAIEVMRAWLRGDATDEDLSAARGSAYAVARAFACAAADGSAYAAARAFACAAAEGSAHADARDAARDAGDAAWANAAATAWDAAWDAAQTAAWDAAQTAAWDAAWDAGDAERAALATAWATAWDAERAAERAEQDARLESLVVPVLGMESGVEGAERREEGSR
jgi:hypothetical protein